MTDWAAIIRRISPRARKHIVEGLAAAMPNLIQIANLTTRQRQAHFLAQAAKESDGFVTTVEYASGAAYQGRHDLQNLQPGDGVRFKGRGLFQLTGRYNYTRMSKILGVDFVANPKLAAEFPWAAMTGAIFWRDHRLNDYADQDNITAITRRVNGGLNGFEDRKRYLARAKAELDEVKLAQARLRELNYAPGAIDGDHGPLTRSAIRDFQDAHDLPVTGNLTPETTTALYSKDASTRPVSVERERMTVEDLREAGSRTIEATDSAKWSAMGAGLSGAAAAATNASTIVQSAKDMTAGVSVGVSISELARDYWPLAVAVLAITATIYFAWRAYRASQRAAEARLEDARAGINVGR